MNIILLRLTMQGIVNNIISGAWFNLSDIIRRKIQMQLVYKEGGQSRHVDL